MVSGFRYAHVENILKKYNKGIVLELGAGGVPYKNIFMDYTGTDLPTTPYLGKENLDVFCDAQYLPFKNSFANMVFTVAALYQIPKTSLVLSEVNRILKLNSYFLIFDYNKKCTKRGNVGPL